ncbi:MAG: YkgJ family cysteine cluster protein [Methanosarcinales archaeon]|nr:YkgJ family cysteine cluster protein [Methanosarcinales archaeon]
MILLSTNCDSLSEICARCQLGGGCCHGAHPPLTQRRIDILIHSGVTSGEIEFAGYHRLKVKDDGFCVLFDQGGCTVHSAKPETCVAGPFTFDVQGDVLEIYLKKESICPLVAYLKEDIAAYQAQLDLAVKNILALVRDLSPQELEVILRIEEPETVKVAEISLEKG